MRFDVVTAVGVKRYVLWDMTTCGSVQWTDTARTRVRRAEQLSWGLKAEQHRKNVQNISLLSIANPIALTTTPPQASSLEVKPNIVLTSLL